MLQKIIFHQEVITMNDMQRLLKEYDELKEQNWTLTNQNTELKYENDRLKRLCSELQATVNNMKAEKIRNH